MHSSYHHLLVELEETYGRLGEAQHKEFERLMRETSSFRKKSIKDMWKDINKALIADEYTPQAENDESMNALFPSGDEFPDIYKGDIDSINMDDLL